MAILPNIGRKGLKVRIAICLIYATLIIGSVTMVYPLMIMLSGSVKGKADTEILDAFPKVAYSQAVQFQRFEEDRYDILKNLSNAYGEELFKFQDAKIPQGSKNEAAFADFINKNIDSFPIHFYQTSGISKRGLRAFKQVLREENGTIEQFNLAYDNGLGSWNDLTGITDNPYTKEYSYDKSDKLLNRYVEFKKTLPAWDKGVVNIDGFFQVEEKSFPEIKSKKMKPLRIAAEKCPTGPDAVLWTEFVKHRLNPMFIKIDAQGLDMFHKFLSQKFFGKIDQFNQINDCHYKSFNDVGVSDEELRNAALHVLYTQFVTDVCPVANLSVDSPSTRFRKAIGDPTAETPFVDYDYSVFKANKGDFLKQAFTYNYNYVIDYIVLYGRAVFNTIVYILLAIGGALLVNPLAAYALSRFKLKSTYSILMFFLTTMAFPGAVTMIPNFLLLKQLHLLNTFWALVLPGLANGFNIFLLKGFFDSIPQEIYESAMLDGAGEWTMFWRFTMALSKPILALIALGAFTGAYTAFMFALIICPDERMWTIMVWLYQMQQGAEQPIIYAALVLAAIPTLLVFVLCQNVIMRGIVVPVEK